jgi:hypothetical protein
VSSAHALRPWAAGLVLACFALALLSLLTPSVPTTDPWGWIVWGREVAHLSLDTSQGGSPSWKPLPVLITTPLSVFGDSLPEAWLVVARATGLLGLAMVVVMAVRLVAGRRKAVAITAGVVAGVALIVSPGWLRSVLHGYSEPLLLGLIAGAVLAHLNGRRTLPLVLLMLSGLGRPELWAVIGVYALWAWRTEALSLRRIVLILLPIPILWFGGDFWGSGDPVHGSGQAASNALIRKVNVGDMLSEIWAGGMPAVPLLALLGLALRPRDRALQVLVGGCVGFVAYLCLLEFIGYPVSARFFDPASGMLCGLAGVGAAIALQEVLRRRHRVVGAVAVAGILLVAIAEVPEVPVTVSSAHDRAVLQLELRDAVSAFGARGLNRCGDPILRADLHWNEGAVAFTIGEHLKEVRRVLPWKALDGRHRGPVVMLAPVGEEPHPRPSRARIEMIGQRDRWGVYRITPAREPRPPPCRV